MEHIGKTLNENKRQPSSVKHRVRNSNIELLRFVLLSFIFLWHLIVHGLDFKDIGHTIYPYDINLTIIAAVLFCPAVNCFMFISGWFGMKFDLRKATFLAIVCIITALISKVIGINLANGGGGTLPLYKCLFPISTKTWWFMTAYMMVFFLSPFIEEGLKSLDKRTSLEVLICMTFIEILSLPVNLNLGSTFFGLMYVYILARYMRLNGINIKIKTSFIMYFGAFMLMIIAEECIYHFYPKRTPMWWLLQYNNPLIIIEAIAIFFMVESLPARKIRWLNALLSPCLCIYLIPEQILPYKHIVTIYQQSIATGILVTVIFMFACLLVGHIIFFISKQSIRFRISTVIFNKNNYSSKS